ncbi:MAG: type II toxin-antitoxin system RelE family toxin [Nitrosotalea sp.]
MWIPERTKLFTRQYKSLHSDLQKNVNLAITELVKSENPIKLGKYKPSIKVYAYVLDKSNRLLYNVSFNEHVIEFIRVGSHKQVYGKD